MSQVFLRFLNLEPYWAHCWPDVESAYIYNPRRMRSALERVCGMHTQFVHWSRTWASWDLGAFWRAGTVGYCSCLYLCQAKFAVNVLLLYLRNQHVFAKRGNEVFVRTRKHEIRATRSCKRQMKRYIRSKLTSSKKHLREVMKGLCRTWILRHHCL